MIGCVIATLVWWGQAVRRPEAPAAAVDPAAPVEAAGPSYPAAPGTTIDDPDDPDERGEVLTVQLTGAIANAGVVTLPSGSRVSDGVDSLGGLTVEAATEAVNLARRLRDGEHVHIPSRPEVDRGDVPSTSTGTAKPGPVDLNVASVEQLLELPGIGPSRASAIVEHREREGPFSAPGDLRDVPGIGEVIFQRLAELIVVG